jgi:hypothetical protein
MYNKSTFPGYFTCGLVYNGHLAGTGWIGLNGLPVILPRVMRISTDSKDSENAVGGQAIVALLSENLLCQTCLFRKEKKLHIISLLQQL